MSLNPGGTNYGWNYSKPDKDGYSLEIVGTVVSMQEVQAREYVMPGSNAPGRPAFWPDGNPRMNIRIGLALQDGSLRSVTFPKAGRKQVRGEKPSLHMQLYGLTNGNMSELMGKTVHLKTWPANPNTNAPWGQGNPRLFEVNQVQGQEYKLASALPDEYKVPVLYANDAVQGGQVVQPQPMQQQAAPMQHQPVPMQQQPMPVQQRQMPVPQQPVPMQQQPVQQPVAQQQMPAGMDPAVAAAMQSAGVSNIQPANKTAYDDEIPF